MATGRTFTDTMGERGWPGGVHLASDSSLIEALASPRGRNSELALATAGIPHVQKRTGLSTVNRTAVTNNPELIGQYEYRQVSSGTDYHVIIGDDGGIYLRGASSLSTSSAAGTLTTGDQWPDFAVASDLLFLVNGAEKLKFDGTDWTNFGITRPTVGTMAGAVGAAGSPNGTYELRVAYGNSATGHISSASDTASSTVTVSSEKIDVSNIPVSSDGQVDQRLIYVRNTSTQTQFYLATTIANNTDTTVTLDFADADLITVAPTTGSNDPPPSGVKFVVYAHGYMFVADQENLYYSKVLEPEAFDTTNRFESFVDGQPITGLGVIGDSVIIFKEDRTYELRGDSPASWELRQLSNSVGCASSRTICTGTDGNLYWWSRIGLCRLTQDAQTIDTVGIRTYGDPTSLVNYSEILRASAASQPSKRRILIAVPEASQERATMILPFSVDLQVFESDRWDPMDAASLGLAHDSSDDPQVWLGNYNGQLFQMDSGHNDGVATGTQTGTFTASGTTVTTITDVDATFDTTGAGLVERKVSLVDSSGFVLTSDDIPRPRIASNDGTSITLNAATGTLVDGDTYTYIIGGPDFAWDTPWRTAGAPWRKKRYEYFRVLTKGVSAGSSARMDIGFNYRDEFNASSGRLLTFTGDSALWDVALWDVNLWDLATNDQVRFRVGGVGFSYKIRLRNAEADEPLAFLLLNCSGVFQTTKR